MAIDLSALADYSWADIAKAAKAAMVNAAMGGSTLTIGTRTITRISVEDAKALYELAVNQQQLEEAGDFDGTALVRFGDPR